MRRVGANQCKRTNHNFQKSKFQSEKMRAFMIVVLIAIFFVAFAEEKKQSVPAKGLFIKGVTPEKCNCRASARSNIGSESLCQRLCSGWEYPYYHWNGVCCRCSDCGEASCGC